MSEIFTKSSDLGTLHIASSRFEAARVLKTIPNTNKFAQLHGHGFMVSAQAVLPCDWALYPGGELPRLRQVLTHHTQLLNYRLLNDVLDDPSDLSLAYWIGANIDVPGLEGIAVQSTPNQGVSISLTGSHNKQVWRRYQFQASHQLPNVPSGHKCGRMHGHGFEVVLRANTDDTSKNSGLDYDILDRSWIPIRTKLNYQCLNKIVGLENPTSEILAAWIWEKLKDSMPNLLTVTVYETASCGATFDGKSYRIWKDFSIDSANRYKHASKEDPHSSLHGYSYTLRLHLSSPLDQVMGWTVDYGDVKKVFDPVFKSLDHHALHENTELDRVCNGDTASMADWIFAKTKAMIPQLVRVDLYETEGCGALVGTNLHGPSLPLARVSEEFSMRD